MFHTARTTRSTRTPYLLFATMSAVALAVTACNGSGTGTAGGDTNASRPAASSAASSSASASPSAKNSDKASSPSSATPTQAAPTAATTGSDTTSDTAGTSSGTSGKTDDKTDETPATTKRTTCTTANTKATLSPVTRPINHLLLTVTNTGSTDCDAYGAPLLGFDGDQSSLRILSESQPQAVVTLAPGESAYASIGLSGDGDFGHRATTLRLFFQGRALAGSVGAVKNLTVPGGSVYVDSSDRVSYWQFSITDALTY